MSKNLPNGLKLAMKYINSFHFKALQNLPKFEFLVLKIHHLATLHQTRSFFKNESFYCQFRCNDTEQKALPGANTTIYEFTARYTYDLYKLTTTTPVVWKDRVFFNVEDGIFVFKTR
jgi:hypothetical protein